ncbi:MAG TPA: lytic murein transglycosylase [Smithella sp.]|nr:lytic murein transglycosylase [Smithella sp.]HOG89329.1 lytic murein transglycosylase [Smithella sp.]HOU50137.1 lytic murein transglycosylase [Smithella sp.]HQG64720.1 lytic murein transglycosylase [Smithella sp.]HQH16463.1 lytic murein transglycosylase [Smithella sp.]
MRYWLMAVPVLLLLTACAAEQKQLQKIEVPKACCEETLPVITKAPDAGSDTAAKIEELKQALIMNGVAGEWLDAQIKHESFQLYSNIDQYFQKAAEKQIDHDKKFDASWYFNRLGVDAKIEKGKTFLQDHLDILKKAEAKHGIHKELIAAIIGIETNFADYRQRGSFYAFNALVSQYIFTNRKNFAVREITALYKFSTQTGRPTQYFTGSYAGAIGWGQFIPSSLLAFFIDSNGISSDIDPFSIEDTIFSVENYLYSNKLDGKNINDYDSKYKAVFAYNHSDVYVQAVLYIYDGLRNLTPAGSVLKK